MAEQFQVGKLGGGWLGVECDHLARKRPPADPTISPTLDQSNTDIAGVAPYCGRTAREVAYLHIEALLSNLTSTPLFRPLLVQDA
jgi:hypothetical protein